MVKKITQHLTDCPSYLKKGDQWLADFFEVSPKTINKIKKNLAGVKREYVNSL